MLVLMMPITVSVFTLELLAQKTTTGPFASAIRPVSSAGVPFATPEASTAQ